MGIVRLCFSKFGQIVQILIKRRLKSNFKFLFYLRTEGQLLSKQPGSPMTFQKCTLTLCKALRCLGYFNFFFFSSMYILDCQFLNLTVIVLSARVVCVSVLLRCRLI